ncbi:MAG: type VI secretion system tip protein VgrG [Thermoanaerobaculia bacterium]|nr:type VI secretion system tip protein VgrG [Thermoanaerobaculia bacterium]
MGEYLQQQRKLRVTTPLGPNELLLKGFSGNEGISTLFAYRLEMVAQNKTKVPFDAVLGEKLTIHMQLPDESSETHLNGLCVRLGQAGRDEDFTIYEAEIVPDVWKLTKKAQSRIFQQLTVPEILKKVFDAFDVDWQLTGKYEPRDYCVQYRETDFAFGARLMEEEGIYFFFEHKDGSHKMIVSDAAMEHPALAGDNKLIYEELEGGTRDENRIWAWKKEQEMRPGKYVLWDHAFELPHKHLEAEATILASVPVGKETHKLKVKGVDQLEVYDFPGAYAQRFDGISSAGGEQPAELQKIFQDNQRTVSIRMDEETTPAVVILGKSNVKHLVSGYKFTLQRHFSGDGDYVVTSVRHKASFGADYRSGKDPLLSYENEFTCIPAALPYRPARTTPRPVVQGSQTAVVVGPSGEEIFTDKYGRVKVQFHWDREGKNDPSSSCWIRVATSWAGRNWGMIHIPRIGQEVIVDFLEGDPDQPIVVGSVYNADMMPPYSLPANKTQSGVKSRSSKGGSPPNFNEIMFEDKKGGELLKIHAERNQSISVEADETHTVGNDRSKSISRDETTSVGRNRTENVAENETITVGVNRVITIGAAETRTIGAAEVVSIGGAFTLAVGGAQSVSVGGNATTNVGGNDSTQIGGSGAIVAGKSLNLQAADAIQLQTGKASITMKKDGTVTIKGKDISIEASGKINVKASSNVTVKGSKISQN